MERGRGGRTGRLVKKNCPSSHGKELPGLADAQPNKLAFKVHPQKPVKEVSLGTRK